jgi:hypothetical protein
MKRVPVRCSLYAISAFLITLSFLDWSTAASADSVFLTCHPTPASGPAEFSRYLTIDYSTKTVVTSDINDTKPIEDVNGRTPQPAQISNSKIVWQVATKRAGGRAYAEHFTLSRLTGDLGYYDDGTRHGESWTCQVGAKPRHKF